MLQETETPPILGSVINEGENAPFADLYYDIFPEWYDVE